MPALERQALGRERLRALEALDLGERFGEQPLDLLGAPPHLLGAPPFDSVGACGLLFGAQKGLVLAGQQFVEHRSKARYPLAFIVQPRDARKDVSLPWIVRSAECSTPNGVRCGPINVFRRGKGTCREHLLPREESTDAVAAASPPTSTGSRYGRIGEIG